MAVRFVKYRAIFTAFSTASAPELRKRAMEGAGTGATAHNFSARLTADSYGRIMKQVWVNFAA